MQNGLYGGGNTCESQRGDSPYMCYILHNESVRERALTLFTLSDCCIIYEVGMCAALYVWMYIASAEMQQSTRCLLARSITVVRSH